MREGRDCILTLWNINDNDDNIVVVVIPRGPASLGCPVAECDTVPLARWVVHGSGDVGVPVVPTCGRWSFWAAGVICGGVASVTWHVGDMEGARSPGDMGVRLSGLVGCLLWFVGGMGCWLWWRLLVGGVVAWHSHGG